MNTHNISHLGLVAICVTLLALEATAAEVAGKVTHVTLYRGQALVTRTVPVEGGRGSLEIVVSGLPEQVVGDSLFAEGSAGMEVRAVRYRARAVSQEPREDLRKLEEEIEATNAKIVGLKRSQELIGKRAAYLDQMDAFVVPTFKADLAKGVLNAESLEKITTFSFAQRKALAEETETAEKALKDLVKQLELLERKQAELAQGASHTLREAVLFVEKHGEGKETARLNYLVGQCGWSPAYTFRAGKDRKDVAVECNALIHQMTGEDWDGVALTLSTASPALSAAGPGLGPFPVTLMADGKGGKPGDANLGAKLQSIRGRQSAAIAAQGNAATLSESIGKSWMVNAAANDFQTLELTNPKEVWSALKAQDSAPTEGPSMSYQLAGGVSLASRADQQMARVLQASFKSVFYQVATPVLTSYVYREAELTNTSSEDLLAGPITVYLEGRFVGRGEIPTVARGQTFLVGFGIDPQLRARRELVNRTEDIQGGNRELGLKYRLVIENYKDEAAPLRVFDRLPHTERTADLRIKLGEMADALSEDKVYLRTERPKGILRWDISVPASATGEKARMIEYGYTLAYDRNLSLSAPVGDNPAATAPAMQMEFEQLQRARMAH